MLQGAGERARKLRGQMSLPEVLLWRALRQRPDGRKFRRQHPSGPYIADFYCHEARLVIEVDGEAHSRGDIPERDARRDGWFAERGVTVFRISAQAILVDLDSVLAGITARANDLIGED